jgi:RNA polymerase sigma-70 factor (ECF subfamily)
VEPRVRFEELYRTHAGAVLAFARRRAVAAVAEDVLSEVFLIAWRRLEDIPEQPLPWLLGVARRVLANRRRAESRTSALHKRLADEQKMIVEGAGVTATPPSSTLLAALASLSERDREVLMFIAWDGLDRAQAAKVLGITTGAPAVRLHRARRRLVKQRDLIEGHQPDSSTERSATMEASR